MVERSDLATATLTSAVPRIRTADRLLLSKRVDASLSTDLKMITLTRPLSHPIYITLQDGRKGVVHMTKNHQIVKLTNSASSTTSSVPKMVKPSTVVPISKPTASSLRSKVVATTISKLTTSSTITSKVVPSSRHTKVTSSPVITKVPATPRNAIVSTAIPHVPSSVTVSKVAVPKPTTTSSKQTKIAAPKKTTSSSKSTSKKRRSTTTTTTTTEKVAILKRKLPIEYMKIPDEKIRRICLHPEAIHFFNNPPPITIPTNHRKYNRKHNTQAETTTTQSNDDDGRLSTTTTESTTIVYRQQPHCRESSSGNPHHHHNDEGSGDPLLSSTSPIDDDVINRLVELQPSSSSFDSDSTLFEPTTELPELEISKLLEEPNDSMEHYHFDPYVSPSDYSSFPAINPLSFDDYHHPQPLQLSPYETYSDHHYPYDLSMYSSRQNSEVFSPTYEPSPHYYPHTPHVSTFNDGYTSYHDHEFQPQPSANIHDIRVSPMHHYQASPAATPHRFLVSQQQEIQQQEYMRSTSSSSTVGGDRYANGTADVQLPLSEPLEHIVAGKKVKHHRSSDVDDSGISSPGSCMSAANSEQIHEDYVNSPHYPAAMVQQPPPYSPSDSAASGFKPYSLTNLDEYTAKIKDEPKYTDLDGVKNLEEAVAMIGIGVQSPLGDSMDGVGSVESNASSIDTVVEVIKPKMEYMMEKYDYKKRNNRKPSKSNGKTMHLWEFIREKLFDPRYCPTMIKWENRKEGVFRFVQSDKIAEMWGRHKNNEKMTYEKLSRAMRYYYSRQILERVDGKRLVYKFGKNSSGWRLDEVCGPNYHDPYQQQHSSPSTPLMIDIPVHQQPMDNSTKWINNNAGSSCQSPTSSLPGANVLLAAN